MAQVQAAGGHVQLTTLPLYVSLAAVTQASPTKHHELSMEKYFKVNGRP